MPRPLAQTDRGTAAWLAHELRQPVLAARMQLDALLDPALTHRDTRAGIEAAVDELGRLADEIDDLAGWASGAAPQIGQVDLEDLVRAAVGRAGATDRVHIRAIEGLVVPADPTRLMSAVTNLVRNALVHGGDGRVEALISARGRWVRVTVRDEGPGVAPGDRARIFRPFERGTGTTAPGAGLGLHLARSVAVDHGGSLELLRSPRGARFSLRLPRWPEPREASWAV